MVDTSGWGGLPDVKIDQGAADALATGCESAASTIRSQCTGRRSATTTAMQDFDGRFSELFQQNQTQANTDGAEIATALEDVAKAVRYLVSIVPDENARRQAAREWKKRHDEDKAHITLSDLGGDEDPPEGPKSPPAPKVVSASAKPRETPAPGGGGGGGGGTSSARPDKLRSFVTGVSGEIDSLHGKPGSLSGHNDDFTAGFDWGTGETTKIDGSSVYAAFRLYNQLNQQDKVWVDTVATAFEQAGGSGGMVRISNATLQQALNAAGVPASRQDIPATSPMLMGIAPTTGYSDDPVNAATGNFVEPETDLAFGGWCVGLALTRMYNSFDAEGGAFGPGWSSWTETRLVLDDESARFVQPDGRASEFPRLGGGWDRALGEARWLSLDEEADELRVTDNDGGTWRFSRHGVPLSHDRGEGTMISLVRADGRLVRLEHERGPHVSLTWRDDRIVAADSSDGRTVTYAYDEGRLVAVTTPVGTRRYRWNDDGLLVAVVDADGVVEVENTYDDRARVTTQLSPHGRVSRYSYLDGHVTEVADLDGTRANTWVHDGRGRLIGLVDSEGNRHSTAYDDQGNAVLSTERDGSATVREFDERGHLTREVAPSGSDLRYAYDDLDRLVRLVSDEGAETTYSYDGSARNPSLMRDPEGGETAFEWRDGVISRLVDPTGVELRFEHDQHGNLVAAANAVGDTARLEYDAAGRCTAAVTPSGARTSYVHGPAGIVERRDPDGAVWHFEYTAGGRLAAVTDPMGARTTIEHGVDGEETGRIDPLGRAVRRRRDDLGNLDSVELPDGSQWRFTHDALSRLTSTTTPDGQTWTRRYDAVGDLAEMVAPSGDAVSFSTDRATGTVVTHGAGGETTERWDALGRQLSAEQSDGSAAIATYDRCGRVVEELDGEGALTRIERDASGRPLAVTSPTGGVTRFEYDACGRRSAVVDPLGARTTIEYDADSRPVRVTQPTGEVGWTRYDDCGRVTSTFRPGEGLTSYAYDAVGRVVETWGSAEGLRRFTFDPAGQLVAATDGNGGTTRFEHDVNGRVVAITDPMGQVTRREFDAMDRCVAETDPLGRTTRAGYDAMGRQAWQEDALGHRTEWSYDAEGQVAAVTLDGAPLARITRDPRHRSLTLVDTTSADGTVVVHEERWNRRGQLLSRSRDGRTMSWSYDAAGRRESMTLPDGQRIGYAHDAAGRLTAVDHPLLGRATLERDSSGRVTKASAGGLVQSWSYADGFVAAHTSTDGVGSTRTAVRRDETGRIAGIERDGVVTAYDYDAACQLVASVTGSESARWRYDACGRIVQETHPEGSRSFGYDAASQLLVVEEPEGRTDHAYDPIGRRTRTTYPDGRTRDLGWSRTGWLASVTDEGAAGTVRTELHVDASAQLASIDGTPVYWDAEMAYAPPLAQIGSTPVLALGPVTAVGAEWVSPGWRGSRADGTDAWSVLDAVTGTPSAGAGLGISPAGQLTLGDLEWLGARVYDASTHGFLSTDPLEPVIGAGWSGNPYSYAGNDPLHALDPTGLKPVSEADLKAANQPWYEKAWNSTKDWVKNNTDYIIGGAMAAAGVAALFIPVVGPAVGGALISAGAETIMQRMAAGKDGQINWGKVAIAGAAGAIGGGSGSIIKTVGMAGAKKVMTTMAVETGTGAAQGFGNYAVDHKGKFDWSDAGMSTLKGGGSGFVSGGMAAKFEPLKDAAGSAAARHLGDVTPNADGIVHLTAKQAIGKSAAEFGVNTVKNAETEVVAGPLFSDDPKDYADHFGKNFGTNMLKSSATGALGAAGPEAGRMEVSTP